MIQYLEHLVLGEKTGTSQPILRKTKLVSPPNNLLRVIFMGRGGNVTPIGGLGKKMVALLKPRTAGNP